MGTAARIVGVLFGVGALALIVMAHIEPSGFIETTDFTYEAYPWGTHEIEGDDDQLWLDGDYNKDAQGVTELKVQSALYWGAAALILAGILTGLLGGVKAASTTIVIGIISLAAAILLYVIGLDELAGGAEVRDGLYYTIGALGAALVSAAVFPLRGRYAALADAAPA